MTHLPPWILNRSRRAVALVLVLSWGLLFACVVIDYQTASVPSPAEEATPDCDTAPADPCPARQRARHLNSLGVDRWHAAGFQGKGVKIAVLDSGFRGYRAHLGKALPTHITVRSFRSDGNLEAKDSQHGILCAEAAHALAPGAELLLANWESDSPSQFLEAVRWARRQGARIITCSIIMPSWSDGDGGGSVNHELTNIIGPGDGRDDVLCFASAGNTAQRHWHGIFHDGGAGVHAWKPGRTCNRLSPWGPERVSVELYWKPGADYDLIVTDARGNAVGNLAAHRGADRSCSVVHFLPREYDSYRVQVRLKEGKPGAFHLVVLGGGLSYATASGSISCPADCPAVLAVGAVHDDCQRAGYSSCGPNSSRPKPDFMAPVPFPSLWRDRPFTGTSAAAPQAAALAALCWSRHPDWNARQVRATLRSCARDLGPPGHDHETGYGLIALPREDLEEQAIFKP